MPRNKDKGKSKQARRAEEWARKGRGLNWDLVWKVLASLFAFAGSMVAVYELVNYFRSDTKTFYTIIFPGLGIIIWFGILFQLFRKKNPYAILLTAVTILGGVVGGISWQSYSGITAQTTQQAQEALEEKLIVAIAAFEGPEEVYGLRNEIKENLDRDFPVGNKRGVIVETIDEIITPDSNSGSQRAVELGKRLQADIVIWGWYRPTENPNITIHIENLSPQDFSIIQESETYQPQAAIADLESFEIQKQIGGEAANLVNFLTGYLLYQIGDYETALQQFDIVKQSENPISVVDEKYLYLYAGLSHFFLEEYSDAITNYGQAIQVDPNLYYVYVYLGAAYHYLDQDERALQEYDRAIELNPNYYDAYGARGISYNFLEQYERAIQDFDKAIGLNPTDQLVYVSRAHAYHELNQYERAIEDCDRAIEIDSSYAVAYYTRGDSYNRLGQARLALPDFDQALRLNPDYSAAYYGRGGAYSLLGQYAQAVQDYKKAIELEPDHATVYYERGIAYYNLGEYERAVQDFGQAIQLDHSYSEAFSWRGATLMRLGKTTEAEADFKKYEELTGQKP